MLRILLADDSLLARTLLRDAINSAPDITVIAEAANGLEAVAMAAALKPDLIVMDIVMPLLGGLEATERIMSESPVPILILSSTIDEKDMKLAFTAIRVGALDVMGKPLLGGQLAEWEFVSRLHEKIRLLSRIRVIHHPKGARDRRAERVTAKSGERSILAIGASTGGPKAVMSIMKNLPDNFGAAMVIVQHISSGFAKGYASWLDNECPAKIRLAENGDMPTPGTALVAPTDCQMTIENGAIKISDAPAVNSCRPSIDVFFDSLARSHGSESVALLLTGMGRDGAQGLRSLRESGAHTIAQDEKSSVVFGMPKAAISLDAACEVVALDDIPETVTKFFI